MSEEEGDSVLREVGQDTHPSPHRELRAGQEHGYGDTGEELVGRIGDHFGEDRVEQGRDTQRDPVRQSGFVVEQFQRSDQIAENKPRRVETGHGGGTWQDEEDDGNDDDGHGHEDGRYDPDRPRGVVPAGREGTHHQQNSPRLVPDHRFEEIAELQAEQRSWRLAARRRRLGQEFEERSQHHGGHHDGTGAGIRAELGLLGATSALMSWRKKGKKGDLFRFRFRSIIHTDVRPSRLLGYSHHSDDLATFSLT